jgi:hypothetical protein
MYRIGEVGDEGTSTLLISDLRTQTTSRDDAVIEMSKIQPFSQSTPPAYYQSNRRSPSAGPAASRTPPARRTPPKPLSAPPPAALKRPLIKNQPSDNRSTLLSYVSSHAMPGIGDDFYEFEKLFGLPTSTDAKSSGWTWALYKNEQPAFTIFTGSKGQTGKVDILVMSIPAEAVNESAVERIAGALAGKLKKQKLGAPTRSVRYLASGRTQFVTRTAPGYKLSYLTPRGADAEANTYILILSRLPGAIDVFMAEHSKRSELLRPLSTLFGAG